MRPYSTMNARAEHRAAASAALDRASGNSAEAPVELESARADACGNAARHGQPEAASLRRELAGLQVPGGTAAACRPRSATCCSNSLAVMPNRPCGIRLENLQATGAEPRGPYAD